MVKVGGGGGGLSPYHNMGIEIPEYEVLVVTIIVNNGQIIIKFRN